MTYELTTESFLRDVKDHDLTLVRDDGLYRHIRFRRPGTSCMYFDLITWPGALCYTGDMGTYVFSRLSDMFEFFRTDQARAKEGELKINPGYWAEKLIAVDGGRRNGKATEFSEEKFTRVINEYVADWLSGHDVSDEDAEALRVSVQEEIIDKIEPQDESYTYRLAHEFTHQVAGDEFYFQDLWDYDFSQYTHSFLWCCHALSWGIQQYDVEKAKAGEAAI